jgi:hypothetical protein
MSVDVSAKIMYGFHLSNNEYVDYSRKCEAEGRDTSDFCCYVNNYTDNSDVIFGVGIESTDYITSINMFNKASNDEWNEWEACLNEWKEDFPDRVNDTPEYFLICHWW